jgi:maleylacetoacetate isomerase/maleylpyruvate isomerase
MTIRLYHFPQSGPSYRVRIALALKGLNYEPVRIDLLKRENHPEYYEILSPDGLVPLLELTDEQGGEAPFRIGQSMAIMEFLDERFTECALLPKDPIHRAHVRSLAQTIACDLHPLNNLRVLRYLSRPLQLDADARSNWYNHWIIEGLNAYEKRLVVLHRLREALGLPSSNYSWGDTLGLADCCLIPQLVNAPRMGLELASLNIPLTLGVFENAMQHKAVQESHPDLF